MNARWRLPALLAIGTVVFAAFLRLNWLGPEARARRAAESARAELKRQGFKLDLGEFARGATTNERLRATKLVETADALIHLGEPPRVLPMLLVSPQAARVAWWVPESAPASRDDRDLPGPAKATAPVASRTAGRDGLIGVLAEGSFSFEVDPSTGAVQLDHLDSLKTLAKALSADTLAALRAGRIDRAATHLTGLIDLIAHWQPEPAAVARLTRHQLHRTAVATTWEALQTNTWTEAQLAGWQRKWMSVDLLSDLPETAALVRAEGLVACEDARASPVVPLGQKMVELIELIVNSWSTPSRILAWFGDSFGDWSDYRRTRNRDSYFEEIAVLRYTRDIEVRWRELLASGNVAALTLPFRPESPSPGPAPNLEGAGSSTEPAAPAPVRMPAVLPRLDHLAAVAVEAETWRRLLLTALSLERHHRRHGGYPERLESLDPDLRDALPWEDPFDGAPLRYRREDLRFRLYSVGSNRRDDGGSSAFDPPILLVPRSEKIDLHWPRPATAEEIEAFESPLRPRRLPIGGTIPERWVRSPESEPDPGGRLPSRPLVPPAPPRFPPLPPPAGLAPSE